MSTPEEAKRIGIKIPELFADGCERYIQSHYYDEAKSKGAIIPKKCCTCTHDRFTYCVAPSVKTAREKLEYKSLGQILNEAGTSGVHWKGWAGNSHLILSQEYIAKVFVESAFGDLLKDMELGKLQSLDKIAWRIRAILGDSQIPIDKLEQTGENKLCQK